MMRNQFLSTLAVMTSLVLSTQAQEQGKVLILRNHRTLFGEVRRVGDQYEIRRNLGRSWISADKVLAVCPDKVAAYRVLRSQSNLADPSERLRLARWCFVQKMTKEAILEAKAALRLRPEHGETQRLVRYFELKAAQAKVKPPTKPKPTKVVKKEDPLKMLAVSVGSQSMAMFTRRVQPLLMNACAKCHARNDTEKFPLKRVHHGALLTVTTTQRNLVAVLSQIDPDAPDRSPLLLNAIRAHGKSGVAPLLKTQERAFATLQNWVRGTLATNPHLRRQLARERPTVPKQVEPKRLLSPEKKPESKPDQGFGMKREPKPTGVAVTPRDVPTNRVLTPTKVKPKDDYDPAVFNQLMHPNRGSPSKPSQ